MLKSAKHIILGSGIVLLTLILWPSVNSTTTPKHYIPTAYNNRVNEIIATGYLTANCTTGELPVIDTNKLEDGTPNPAPEAERLWYQKSNLKEDVRRFNEDPSYRWIFDIDDNCTLKTIHPAARIVALPFANQQRWHGKILYGDKDQTSNNVLRSVNRDLVLRYPLSGDNDAKISVGTTDSEDASRLLLHFYNQSRQAAYIHYVGNQIVVNNLTAGSENKHDMVNLMGYKMPIGRYAWLQPGDWLQLKTTKPRYLQETFVFVTATPQAIASTMRLQNDHKERETQDDQLGWFYDDATNQPIPFLDMLVQQIDKLLDQDSTANKNFNLQLTLQRQLQQSISNSFHEQCERLRHDFHHGHIFDAGMTIMDGKTGAILAAATYPWPTDLPPSIETRKRYNLLRNQNFVRHPIGSVIKPFLYSAIAQQHQYFLTMSIDGYSPNDTNKQILYCNVNPGYQVLNEATTTVAAPRNARGRARTVRERIDFSTALTRSSNKFTVEIAALALAAGADKIKRNTNISCTGNECSSININGQRLNYAPDLTQYLDITATNRPIQCQRLKTASLAALPYRTALERLTGVPSWLGLASQNQNQQDKNDCFYQDYVAQQYDMSLLQPLFQHFTAGNTNRTCEVRKELMAISPEQVNLGFNKYEDFRKDYITFALGGGRSVWTNIQLTEALSRLVTNQQINAKLIDSVEISGTDALPTINQQPTNADWQPLHDNVRQAVLTGMAGVVNNSHGTAHSLLSQFTRLQNRFPNDRLFIFSKTGTPTIVEQIPKATGEVLKRLNGTLFYENNQLKIKFKQTTAVYDPNDTGAFRNILANLLITMEYKGAVAQKIIGSLFAIINEFYDNRQDLSWSSQSEVPADIDSPLYVVGEQLRINDQDDVFNNRQRKTKGAVYLFSLVKIPNTTIGSATIPTPAQIQDQGSQVITVVLHMNLGLGSRTAVSVARQLLGNIAMTFNR